MKFTQLKVVIISILSLTFLFSSCAKSDMNNFDNPTGGFAAVSAFNGMGYGAPIEMMIDQKMVNSGDERLTSGGYIGFKTVFPGSRKVEIRFAGGSSYHVQEQVDFKSKNFYSYFFYGLKEFKYLVSVDDLSVPRPGMAKVRIVNLIENQPVVVNSVQGNSQSSFTAKVEVTNFMNVPLGEIKYDIQIAGTRSGNISFELDPSDQKLYTICLYAVTDEASKTSTWKHKIIQF